MSVLMNKQNIDKLDMNSLRDGCNQALDLLWKSEWIESSMTKADRTIAEPIQTIAKDIAEKANLVVVVATGHQGRTIKAATDAVERTTDFPEVLVFGESLSSGDYARLITRLEKEDFVLIGATEGEESLQFRAAFATVKQLLIEKYGTVQSADRIYAVAGTTSTVLSHDASENDYPLMNYPDNLDGLFAANTTAALLPLAIKGVDLDQYLNGFYDMLSSPTWDLDRADYAMAKAAYLLEKKGADRLLIWQDQLDGFGRWAQAFGAQVLSMPRDEEFADEECFETMLVVKEGWSDIMTPPFQGCHEDGSLNLLLADTWEKYFLENKIQNPGFCITVERLDDYGLGEFLAFLQLSNGITKILLEK